MGNASKLKQNSSNITMNSYCISILLLLPLLQLFIFDHTVMSSSVNSLCSNSSSNEEKIDLLAARIISFSDVQRPFPENKTTLPAFCKGTKEDMKELNERIKNCLPTSSKQFANILLYSVRKTLRGNCNTKNTKRLQTLYDMAKCVNKHRKKLDCLIRFSDAMVSAKHAKPPNTRIGYICCEFYKTLACVNTKLTQQHCSPDVVNDVETLVRNTAENNLDTLCGDYTEHSDKCNTLKPLPKKKSFDVNYKSFVMPLVNVLNSI